MHALISDALTTIMPDIRSIIRNKLTFINFANHMIDTRKYLDSLADGCCTMSPAPYRHYCSLIDWSTISDIRVQFMIYVANYNLCIDAAGKPVDIFEWAYDGFTHKWKSYHSSNN